MKRVFLLCVGLGLAACSDDSYIVVTVTNRPAVHDATNLRVTLSNAGSERTDDISLANIAFPLTFSISAPDRSGELGIAIEATNVDQLLVGKGTTSTTIDATSASVMLDTTDFVVNTVVVGDQYPEEDYEAHGFQLASAADGSWTAVFRDGIGTNIFARRFDATGEPMSTRAAAGPLAFTVSSIATTSSSVAAIATAGDVTLAVWDYAENAVRVAGVACRAIDAAGMLSATEVSLALDDGSDVVTIAPLSNKNFVVAWTAGDTSKVIRRAIVRPDCTTLAAAVTVSTVGSPRRPTVASNGTTILYAWRLDGAVRVRVGNLAGGFSLANTDTEFLPLRTTESVESVRVAPLGTGYAILVRWALSTGSKGPGRIELYRTNNMGAVLGPPTVVTKKSGTDFQSSEAFGAATRSDGTLFVTWHACLENGDSQGCGVYGQAVDAAGVLKGSELTIPTTIIGNQTNPSVAPVGPDAFAVIWRDDSMQAPDTAGAAVRARIVYVP